MTQAIEYEDYLLEIRRYTQSLIPKTQVRCDSNAFLSDHGYNGATVVFHNRLIPGLQNREIAP